MNRPTSFLIGLSALLFSCGESAENTTDQFGQGQDPKLSELEARMAAATGQPWTGEPGSTAGYGDGGDAPAGTRTHTIHSTTYQVPMAQIDLPEHWNVEGMATGNWTATAPGVSVRNSKPSNFMLVGGQLGQFYQANNQPMRAPVAPEQVVLQDIAPRLRQQGYELIGQAPEPGVESLDQRAMNSLYVPGQAQRTCKANLSQWRRGDKRLAVVLHWFNLSTADMANWGYYTTELEASTEVYEREKNALLNALTRVRYNPAYFAAQNRQAQMREQQTIAAQQQDMRNTQASWDAHNARMRSNQAAFDASQAAHRDMVNGVNNSIMGTWNNTNATMDRMQDATINGIRGEQNAWNPQTGQPGKVEAGYNNYWVNGDGQYIGTNDVMFDPNVNGQWVDQWQQMETER
ncbi:MAG: hypothetical protein ACO1NQ_06575 [Flavobacteriales bacterium]